LNETTPDNIVEILENAARDNFKELYKDFDYEKEAIKPITEINPELPVSQPPQATQQATPQAQEVKEEKVSEEAKTDNELSNVEETAKALDPIVNKRKSSPGVKLRNLVGLITHNGEEVIKKFDPSKIVGQTRGRYGKGFYFSSLFKNFDYGDKSTYLDSSKLNLLDGDISVSQAINKLLFTGEVVGTIYKLKELLSKSKNNREYNEILEEIKRLEEQKSSIDKNEVYIKNALEKAVRENPNQDFGSLLENLESRVIEANKLDSRKAVKGLNESLNNLLLKSGFDGISFTEGNEILIIPQEKLNDLIIPSQEKAIAEAYHKAKQDGSNPELVQAVEELLGKKEKTTPTETVQAQEVEQEVAETSEFTEEETQSAIKEYEDIMSKPGIDKLDAKREFIEKYGALGERVVDIDSNFDNILDKLGAIKTCTIEIIRK